MLMLAVLLLIGSVHAFFEKCPESCRQIELYLGEEHLTDLEECTEIKTNAYIEDLETTCEQNVRCRKALSQSEFEYGGNVYTIYIHITAASRAVWYIARACAGDILYVPEGFSPRRTYFRIARRAHRARVLYDFSAREARLIWNISTRGALSKTHLTIGNIIIEQSRFSS